MVGVAGLEPTTAGARGPLIVRLRSLYTAYFFSCVGDDEPGRHYSRTLTTEAAVAQPERTLHTLPGTPQSCCVILSGPADRAMCSCYDTVHGVSISLFEKMLLDGEPWALVHLGGYFNCIGLHDDATLRVLESLKARGALLSMDPQHDCSGKWTGENGHLARLLPLLDVFMPNEAELTGLTGAPSLEEGLAQLAAEQPQLLIVNTRGADGLCAVRGSERWDVAALPVSSFVDATGAGDACAAGFLSSFLRNPADVEAALRCGAAAGALCVSVAGACERPITAEQVGGELGGWRAKLQVAAQLSAYLTLPTSCTFTAFASPSVPSVSQLTSTLAAGSV